MSDMPTIVETGNNAYNPYGAFGGAGWLGAIGGLILGNMWGGNGLWGGGRGAGQVGADVALQSGIQNLSNQVQESTISGLQSSQATQNAINANSMANVQSQNASTMALMNQMNAQGAGITAGINQNTINQLQGTANVSQQICQLGCNIGQQIDQNGDMTVATINNVSQSISDKLCAINNNITAQNYENRLQAQALSAQSAQQHAQAMAQNDMQHCQDRELMRQIATEALQGKLTEAQAKIVQLETQNYVNQSNSQQTLYLIEQLKAQAATAARTTSAATGS